MRPYAASPTREKSQSTENGADDTDEQIHQQAEAFAADHMSGEKTGQNSDQDRPQQKHRCASVAYGQWRDSSTNRIDCEDDPLRS